MPKKLRPAGDLVAFKCRTLKVKQDISEVGRGSERIANCKMRGISLLQVQRKVSTLMSDRVTEFLFNCEKELLPAR